MSNLFPVLLRCGRRPAASPAPGGWRHRGVRIRRLRVRGLELPKGEFPRLDEYELHADAVPGGTLLRRHRYAADDGNDRGERGKSVAHKNGAEDWNRTSDTSIFSAVLYQLSYLGTRRTPLAEPSS